VAAASVVIHAILWAGTGAGPVESVVFTVENPVPVFLTFALSLVLAAPAYAPCRWMMGRFGVTGWLAFVLVGALAALGGLWIATMSGYKWWAFATAGAVGGGVAWAAERWLSARGVAA
jgi:hypothetical protein